MTLGILAVCLLVLLLAWANGANDIAKGVATLVGNGTTHARRAVLWGTLWTMLGGLAALMWGAALINAFTKGFLSPNFIIDLTFVAGVTLGAVAWVGFATRAGLPVSTTHALLGGIVGAALVGTGTTSGTENLHASAVASKALLPLLLSPLIAIGLCVLLLLIMRYVAKKIPAWSPGCCPQEAWQKNPFVCAAQGRAPAKGSASAAGGRMPGAAATQPRAPATVERVWIALHWLSSGTTSFARGLNDVPKIAAFMILALTLAPPAVAQTTASWFPDWLQAWPILLVTLVMGAGCLWGGFKVLDVLAHRVTPLDASSGLVANMGTSILVLAASPLGLPVSTTHVSTGALMGVRWTDRIKPNQNDTLKLILFGWVVTLPIAALVAAASSLFMHQF